MKLARFLGPLWMMVFCVFLPLGDTLTRLVRESGVHVTQVIFIEYALITLALIPFASKFGTTGIQDKTILNWHLLRCVSFFGAALFWIGVLHLVPLTQLFAIGFLAPLFASGLSIMLLNERMTMPKFLCLLSGLAGTLVIIRPGFTTVSPYLLLGLLSPICWAFTMVSTKKLTQTVSASMLLTIMAGSTTLLSFPFALYYWIPINPTVWIVLASVAVIGLIVHFALIKAYEHADITVLAPLEFSTLLFATGFSVLILKESLEIWTYIGATLIVASNLYITFKTSKSA